MVAAGTVLFLSPESVRRVRARVDSRR
jgi:hypothetical protein